MITLEDQLNEARREVALRKKTYPGWVERGRMTQGQADYHLAVMEEIVRTFTRLEEAERQPSLFGTRMTLNSVT